MNFEEFLRRCIRTLNESKIEYVIVGGVLVSIYGEPRATRDVDVIIDLEPENEESIRNFLTAMRKYDLDIMGGVETIRNALKERIHFTVFNKSYLYWMDVQGIYSILDKIVFETRRKMKILGMDTWVESLEALIVAKLSIYYSDQSVRDVRSMIELNRDSIDKELLYAIADKIGVRRRVEKMLSEIGI